MPNILDYANPTRFLTFARIVLPWLSALTLALLAVGLYGAFTAPPDYQQGETVRIMYIHVPSAWLAMEAKMENKQVNKITRKKTKN
jgi:heme exporter protein C